MLCFIGKLNFADVDTSKGSTVYSITNGHIRDVEDKGVCNKIMEVIPGAIVAKADIV